MKATPLPALAALALATSAQAFTEVGANLPTFAANPQLADRPDAQWSSSFQTASPFAFTTPAFSGLSGAQTFTSVLPLSKNVTLGVQSFSGSSAALFSRGPTIGHDFSGANFQFNYNMGRLTPFVTGSVFSVRPNLPGGMNFGLPGVSANDVKSSATIGAGFNYMVNEKFSFGVAVSAGTGQGLR